jgi:hypothetical protein
MYLYECMRCGYRLELEKRRYAPFRSPHEDRRKGILPHPRCNDMFQRVWMPPYLNGLETRRKG